MTRKMLIIANPGEVGAENYCDGVNKDISAYKYYFTSAIGGGWYDSEINVLIRPFPSEVNAAIEKMRTIDYTMIVFCGHGYSYNDETILELKKDFSYKASSLRTYSTRRTIILDCCRKIEKNVLEKMYEFSARVETRSAMSIAEARKYYEDQIMICSPGLVILNACDLDETAGDDSRKGGYYSYSLRDAAIYWGEGYHQYRSSLSVVGVHNAAVGRVRQLTSDKQNPQIEKPRSEPYFPFAVVV